jgi:glycosyltransferase involved in cell wall biosynthesis
VGTEQGPPKLPDRRALEGLRVAIVHDYLNQPGGAEKVVEVFADMFPRAPIYTSVYDADSMPDFWRGRDVRTTFLQRISPRLSIARALLPLYPTAFEQLDLRAYDLVLSSTTAFAKGVITRPETCHVCYCNNPTRFFWMYHDYVDYEALPAVIKRFVPAVMTPLRVWDFAAAQRVDFFIAGSANAARRIAKYYRRDSDVVHSPVDCCQYRPAHDHGDYFLVVARLLSYKRIDLAVRACTELGVPLHVVGDGSDRSRLERLAGPRVRFFGRVGDDVVRDQLARCKALIWPGEEDFGLVPIEAQASGRPVIAYAAGGALETVIPGKTGLFFREPTVTSLRQAIETFEDRYDPDILRANALRFDTAVFKRKMWELLSMRYLDHTRRFGPART